MIELFTDDGHTISISKSMVTIRGSRNSIQEEYVLDDYSKEVVEELLDAPSQISESREEIANCFIKR